MAGDQKGPKTSSDEFPTILLVGYNGGWPTPVEGLRSDGYHVLVAQNHDDAVRMAAIHSRQIHVVLVHASMSASTLASILKPFRLGVRVLHDTGLPIETSTNGRTHKTAKGLTATFGNVTI